MVFVCDTCLRTVQTIIKIREASRRNVENITLAERPKRIHRSHCVFGCKKDRETLITLVYLSVGRKYSKQRHETRISLFLSDTTPLDVKEPHVVPDSAVCTVLILYYQRYKD